MRRKSKSLLSSTTFPSFAPTACTSLGSRAVSGKKTSDGFISLCFCVQVVKEGKQNQRSVAEIPEKLRRQRIITTDRSIDRSSLRARRFTRLSRADDDVLRRLLLIHTQKQKNQRSAQKVRTKETREARSLSFHHLQIRSSFYFSKKRTKTNERTNDALSIYKNERVFTFRLVFPLEGVGRGTKIFSVRSSAAFFQQP